MENKPYLKPPPCLDSTEEDGWQKNLVAANIIGQISSRNSYEIAPEFMPACVYNTDRGWLAVLREHSIRDAANFWRKDQRNFSLPPSSPFYFKVRGTKSLAGRARFVRQSSMSISEAWGYFGTGNGVNSEKELQERAAVVLDLESGAKINCLILDAIELLDEDFYVDLEDGEFPPTVMASKFYDDDAISRIEGEFEQRLPTPPFSLSALIAKAAKLETEGVFDPNDILTARESVLRAIALRRGQSAFRQRLLTTYQESCAVTGINTVEVLEAAHIVPYHGADTNTVQNGILLRADWHTLFDLGYWTLTDDFRIILSKALSGGDYRSFDGQLLRLPSDHSLRPSLLAIRAHRERIFGTSKANRVNQAAW